MIIGWLFIEQMMAPDAAIRLALLSVSNLVRINVSLSSMGLSSNQYYLELGKAIHKGDFVFERLEMERFEPPKVKTGRQCPPNGRMYNIDCLQIFALLIAQ